MGGECRAGGLSSSQGVPAWNLSLPVEESDESVLECHATYSFLSVANLGQILVGKSSFANSHDF